MHLPTVEAGWSLLGPEEAGFSFSSALPFLSLICRAGGEQFLLTGWSCCEDLKIPMQ